MVLPALPDIDRIKQRIQAPDYRDWRKKVEDVYGCLHPVRLSGLWEIADKTSGDVLKSHGGHIFAPCGNRRESVCPACSDRYAADAFHLLRAGLSGGSKGVPVEVADKPRLFVTLTAPSFGPVHNRRTTATGKHAPCRCGRYHHEHDPQIGQPTDPGSYDYTRHVLWQAHVGKLWNLFTKHLRRRLARAAGLTVRDFADHARLSYAKVAEFQRRGIIHLHAVIRLDGPNGAVDTTPAWGTPELLADAVHAAHTATHVEVKGFELDGAAVTLAWGEQLDIRPIRPADAHQVEDGDGTISDDRIASYVAKYATKGTGKSEAADRPIRSRTQIELLRTTEHHKQIMRTAWDLGAPIACPDCHPHGEHHPAGCACASIDHCATCDNGGLIPGPLDELNLRRWCHMLAFRGHFLSKSRAYSTTFKQLREDRQIWRFEQNLAELGVTADTVTVINHWDMTSVGHRTDEERELAAAIAERTRAARKHRYNTERKD
ncbi:replication initiator [Saccharopolyspora phatthalungensis]|nr:replication initiator [Saccharopolyspora phatthalungensis]